MKLDLVRDKKLHTYTYCKLSIDFNCIFGNLSPLVVNEVSETIYLKLFFLGFFSDDVETQGRIHLLTSRKKKYCTKHTIEQIML